MCESPLFSLRRFTLRKLFFVVVALLLSTSQAAAWPWNDSLDEFENARFEVSCCINKALHTSPYPEYTNYSACAEEEKRKFLDCMLTARKNQQFYRNTLATKYCGELEIDDERKRAGCERKFSVNACSTAADVGKTRAMRECP